LLRLRYREIFLVAFGTASGSCASLIRLDRRARRTENLGWVRHRGPIR